MDGKPTELSCQTEQPNITNRRSGNWQRSEQGLSGGGKCTGNSFQAGDSAAICRFYGSESPGPNSHFYTIDAGECNFLKQLQARTPATQKRWNFEGLGFLSIPPTNGVCPGATLPIHRAYNNGFARGIDGKHRFTTNPNVMQQVLALGWIAEGVVMCAPQ